VLLTFDKGIELLIIVLFKLLTMTSGEFGNPLRKFKLVFLGEQSGIQYVHFMFIVVTRLTLLHASQKIILFGLQALGIFGTRYFERHRE